MRCTSRLLLDGVKVQEVNELRMVTDWLLLI